MRSSDIQQRPVFFALAIGLILTPMAFGGTTGWFTSVFAIYTGATAVLWAVTARTGNGYPGAGSRIILLAATLVGIAVFWCFAQAWMPAPPGIPHDIWSEASALLALPEGQIPAPVISVNPQASVSGALRLSGYCLVFFLCHRIALVERRADRLLAIITLAGTAYALYGIALELSGSGYVLWYERDFEPGNLSSTFPNRNAFADYAALCLMCGYALMYRARIRRKDLDRGWLSAAISVSVFYLRRNSWLIYASAILFISILMTHSRGGLLVTMVSLTVLTGCAMRNAHNRKFVLISIVVLAVCAAILFGLVGGATMERFSRIDTASLERYEIFELTIKAIGDHPILGTGLGTFSDIFAAYRTETLLPQIDFAHNSFLENALEMGLPAATLFYAGLMALFIFFVRSLFVNRHTHPYPALAISTMALGFSHSLFDYPDQFPAVAITFAAILGIAAARSSCVAITGTPYAGTDRRQT